jgi:hypothetical protein
MASSWGTSWGSAWGDAWGTVAVDPNAPTVSIDQGASASVAEGNVIQLTATTTNDPTLVWESDDELIATVDADTGFLVAVAEGTCTVTVTATNDDGEDEDSIDITVTAAVEGEVASSASRMIMRLRRFRYR